MGNKPPILNGWNPTQKWKHSAGMAFEKCFFGPMGQSEQKEYSTGGWTHSRHSHMASSLKKE